MAQAASGCETRALECARLCRVVFMRRVICALERAWRRPSARVVGCYPSVLGFRGAVGSGRAQAPAELALIELDGAGLWCDRHGDLKSHAV